MKQETVNRDVCLQETRTDHVKLDLKYSLCGTIRIVFIIQTIIDEIKIVSISTLIRFNF